MPITKPTLRQFQDRVLWNLGYLFGDDSTLDTHVVTWVNEALNECYRVRWYPWAQTNFAFTITGVTGTMPSAARAPVPGTFRIYENSAWKFIAGPLSKEAVMRYRANFSGQTGSVRRFWLHNFDVTTDTWVLAFNPYPTASTSAEGSYWRRPPTLSASSDVFAGPSELAPAILDYALYRAHQWQSHRELSPKSSEHLMMLRDRLEDLANTLRPSWEDEHFDFPPDFQQFSDDFGSNQSTNDPLDLL